MGRCTAINAEDHDASLCLARSHTLFLFYREAVICILTIQRLSLSLLDDRFLPACLASV